MLQLEYVYPIGPTNKKYFSIYSPVDQVMPVWTEEELNSILSNYGGTAYYSANFDTFFGKHELSAFCKEVIIVHKPHDATHFARIFENGISYLRGHPEVKGAFEVYNPYFGKWMPIWMAIGWMGKVDITALPN